MCEVWSGRGRVLYCTTEKRRWRANCLLWVPEVLLHVVCQQLMFVTQQLIRKLHPFFQWNVTPWTAHNTKQNNYVKFITGGCSWHTVHQLFMMNCPIDCKQHEKQPSCQEFVRFLPMIAAMPTARIVRSCRWTIFMHLLPMRKCQLLVKNVLWLLSYCIQVSTYYSYNAPGFDTYQGLIQEKFRRSWWV